MDAEKPRHRTVITSDVRQQITLVNQKAREEWEKKQAEEEKLRKLNDVRTYLVSLLMVEPGLCTIMKNIV